jgi:hypothetical protein
MKVLVATGRSQGLGPDDRNDCLEGELVWIPPQCKRIGDDGEPCSCATTFTGCATHGLTTTALVHDMPVLSRPLLVKALRLGVCADCWPARRLPLLAETIQRTAAAFPTGTIVERSAGGGVRARFCPEHSAEQAGTDDSEG